MEYIKHFAEMSNEYLRFRPTYPKNLFNYLANVAQDHEQAWDVGTGNGQAAFELASNFKHVIGTDINQQQLDKATKKENITYLCAPAENTKIADESIDLITVAQALHWFNLSLFYPEVRRVSKKKGMIAVWCYSLGSINPSIDAILKHFYLDVLGDYWPEERRYIDDKYRSIPFPFEKLTPPKFFIEKKMDFEKFMGYLSTWSAAKEFQSQKHDNPLSLISKDFEKAWGDVRHEYLMSWPIHLLVGYII